ncbi:MAG: methyltransferase domain-containing protein [Verrucomicrobia bacterium]|jgi:ubiquinone/menaquinone biosynthesis C-methylase UbiE|nr:methyltransferase domain-containing protein [Verrucomicrobiota bacterium]
MGVGIEVVREFYDQANVVEHYRRATAAVGLWASEELILREVFSPGDRILELGTGTGRIAVGLAELGYRNLLGIELSRPMVKEARRIAQLLELSIAFRQGDATQLKFEDNLFEGAIFGFNGLMQIPGREQRRAALREIRRVLQPGRSFVFTAHDRENPKYRNYWKQERKRWSQGDQDPDLTDFGDRYEDTDLGRLFIHVPTVKEVREDLKATGWICEWERPRSALANEPFPVREFSDECRFYLARKCGETGPP